MRYITGAIILYNYYGLWRCWRCDVIQEGGKTGRNLNFAMNNIDTVMTVPAGETN